MAIKVQAATVLQIYHGVKKGNYTFIVSAYRSEMDVLQSSTIGLFAENLGPTFKGENHFNWRVSIVNAAENTAASLLQKIMRHDLTDQEEVLFMYSLMGMQEFHLALDEQTSKYLLERDGFTILEPNENGELLVSWQMTCPGSFAHNLHLIAKTISPCQEAENPTLPNASLAWETE